MCFFYRSIYQSYGRDHFLRLLPLTADHVGEAHPGDPLGKGFFSNANNCRIAIGFPHENVRDVVDLKHHRLKGASLMMMSFIHGGFCDWFICRGTRDSRHSPTRCFSWGFNTLSLAHQPWNCWGLHI